MGGGGGGEAEDGERAGTDLDHLDEGDGKTEVNPVGEYQAGPESW